MIGIIKGYSQEKQQNEFDHILIFCKNQKLEQELNKLFTPAEKLVTVHKSQGTLGHYFLFFNTFIELLYIHDSSQIINNQKRFGSQYIQRWNNSNSYPFAFGLNLKPWKETIDTNLFHQYYSQDSPDNEFYIMSKSNQDVEEPMLYWSMPKRAYKKHDDIASVRKNTDPKIVEDLISYLNHPSGIKRLTKIILHSKHDIKSNNFEILKESELIELKEGKRNIMTLEFDNHAQGKSMYYSGDVELMIHY